MNYPAELKYSKSHEWIKMDGDVAVIGISDIDIAKYTNPPLTTIHIPTETIGEVAANVLLARMTGSQLPPQKILQPISLKIRDSV